MKVTITVELEDASFSRTVSTTEGNPRFHGAEAEAAIWTAGNDVVRSIEGAYGKRPNDSVTRMRAMSR